MKEDLDIDSFLVPMSDQKSAESGTKSKKSAESGAKFGTLGVKSKKSAKSEKRAKFGA